MANKKSVYFNEFNILMGDSTYFPLVSGLLRAHAETNDAIRNGYTFAPYLFYLDEPGRILDQYDNPAVAAFSISMWNEQLSLHVAREVKKKFPKCKIIVGGAQVPHDARSYMEENYFIDIAVRGEGEESFSEILERYLTNDDMEGIPGITWRISENEIRHSLEERPFNRDLDVYPSPYIEGLYDELLETRQDISFQSIIETNRGCPFKCTFCYWGKGGLSRKYRYHSMDRVQAEIEWMGKREIRYVFNADSNFGMHRRDIEIANYLVETKNKYGFPEKFRTCYGKNTDEKIYQIGTLLRENDLEKGITISYQSYDPEVQKNIKRDNIKLSSATELQRKFNESDVPIYTELILGLPGETTETWFNGIDGILESGLKNQLFTYICQVYPNTDLGNPDYQKKFGIITKPIEINEIHGSIRSEAWVPEYEHVVIRTNSMSTEDWRRMLMFSWITMLFHSLKAGTFVSAYLHSRLGVKYSEFFSYISDGLFPDHLGETLRKEIGIYNRKIDRILEGRGRGCELPDYGPIYWDEEEASFLRISEDLDGFTDQLQELVRDFLKSRSIDFDDDELAEIIIYQRMRLPSVNPPAITEWTFARNIPEFFDRFFEVEPIVLERTPQVYKVSPIDYDGDHVRYAREAILWARKSGTILVKGEWRAELGSTRPSS